MEIPNTLEKPERVFFDNKTFALMGGKRKYYLSLKTKKPKGLHVAVWEFFNNRTIEKGFEIHHVDGNTFNNSPENLECISRNEHRKTVNLKTENVRIHLNKIRHLTVAWHRSDEGRKWHRENAKKTLLKIKKKEFECAFCKSKFMAKNTKARFCKRSCDTKWRYYNVNLLKVIVCVICKNEFNTKTYKSRKRTCSTECRRKLTLANKKFTT